MPSILDGYEHNRRTDALGYNSDVTNPNPSSDELQSTLEYQVADVAQSIPDSSIPGSKMDYVEIETLRSGTIYSKRINLEVTPGVGDVYIAAGKNGFSNTEAGFILGVDDTDDTPKFYIGNTTNYLNWDGTTLTISGSLIAGEIHIPDLNTTANSFHVESDGSGWIGATSTNRATAPIQWTPAGVWDVGNGTTYMRMDGPNGVFKSSNYVADSAGFQITTGGLAEFENIKARGVLQGTTFRYDVVSAVGGQLIVSNADTIDPAMTASDTAILTTKGNSTFAANDMLLVRAVTGSGIQEEYMRITSLSQVADYYSESGVTGYQSVRSGSITAIGQTATAVAGTLSQVKFFLKKNNLPTGNATAKIYALTGTAGTNAVPTGAALATSDVFDVSTLTTTGTLKTFTFSGANRITLAAGTNYGVAIDYTGGDASNYLQVGFAAKVDDGNCFYYNGSWTNSTTVDLIFYLYEEIANQYVVTRDLAGTFSSGSNPAWEAGTSIVKIGESDGAATYSGGWLRLLGEGTNAPYYSVFSRTGVAYNSSSERVRMGNLNGVGSVVVDAYGIFAGNYSTGQYIQYDDVSGNFILNGSKLSNEALFGDGSDGDATISSNASLTSDTFYNNLTITSGAILTTNGYRLFVRGTLTINSGCYVQWNGVAGGNGGNGGDGFTDGATATGGAAGAAGTAGTALTDGSVPGSLAGPAGGAGGAGVARTGGGNTAGNTGTNGTTGTNQAKCMVATASAGAAGGHSGDSNPPSFFGGQSGGTAGAAGTNTSTILNEIRNYISAYLLYDPQDAVWYNTSPGTGGGGGGASGAVTTGAYRGASGGGGGGGGAGSSGGTVAIFARILVNNGTIRAVGGNGGNGGNGGAASNNGGLSGIGGSGGGSGGSGGNGGVLVLVYSSYSGSGTTSVAAGTGGTGGSSAAGLGNGVGQGETNGTAGNAGVAGVSITLQV